MEEPQGDGWLSNRGGALSSSALLSFSHPHVAVGASRGTRGYPTVEEPWDGGHSVGVSHCSLFQGRLYNFQDTEKSDPPMDPLLLSTLKNTCPRDAILDNTAILDQGTVGNSTIVGNTYYQEILMRKSILQLDQELALHPSTNNTVKSTAMGDKFSNHSGQAMVKLGAAQLNADAGHSDSKN
ncbi:hypothetical protein RJ639_044758 [Escallonia herrerae]|uniref:peroxidase n=1 Tax=Escallonia herrerae TaxID=1293975 RepID=A0AA89B009_9ASTE|nr:hypothetical protein RJ639_044758 [Escallonia herrerae]